VSDTTTGFDVWESIKQAVQDAPPADEAGDLWERLAVEVDPGAFRPKLAPDIEIKDFTLRWGNDYSMVANPRELLHYKLEPNQAKLVRMMDGSRTVSELVVEAFQDSGDLELSGVADLIQSLYIGNFFERRFTDVEGAVEHAMHPSSKAGTKAREFSKSLSIEWKNADRFVRWLYEHGFKIVFRRSVRLGGAAVAILGMLAFISIVRSHRFALSGHSLALGFLVLLFLNYFLIFVHELAHSLVLIRYKRRIRSAGFGIYFGSPSFYIDSSDGLMLERTERMAQAFAGPYAEMMVAGVGAIVAWSFPEAGFSSTLYKFCVLNYLFIFLNLIPLLELDGYWILSDLIQVPELRPMSLAFVRHDLWHKLRTRSRFSKQEVGLALYGTLGVAFTIVALGASYFSWREIFGGLVSQLWRGGSAGRILLIALGVLVAGPLLRGLVALGGALGRRLRALASRIRFRLERTWRVEAAELIDGLALFDDVPEDVLSDLAGRVTLRRVSRGQPVVRQGERASAFYVVRGGTFEVVEENTETGNDRVLRILGRGDAFGEVGLAEAAARSATVRALEEGQLFEIDKSTFDRLLADMVKVPEFAPTVQSVGELRAMRPFAGLEPDELAELFQRGGWVRVSAGETVIEEGQAGDAFYAVESGRLDVTIEGRYIRTIGPGDHFGEIALLLDVPRTATVTATTPARLFRLEREGFDRLMRESFRRGTLNPHISPDRTWAH
jgi:CRP-like cAMP-binding protein/Zn-dependent protease